MVYDNAAVLYAEVAQTGKEIIDAAFTVLFRGSKHLLTGGHDDFEGEDYLTMGCVVGERVEGQTGDG